MEDFPGKSRVRVRIPVTTIIFFAAVIVIDCTSYTFLTLAAAVIHECGHLAVMRLLSAGVEQVTLYPFGADIQRRAGILSYREDFMIAGAGIAANLTAAAFCLPFAEREPVLYFLLSNLLLAVLNLMPVSLLDGGCMLRSVLSAHLEADTAERLMDGISLAFLVFLWMLSLYILFYTASNLSLFLLCAYLFTALFLSPSGQK